MVSTGAAGGVAAGGLLVPADPADAAGAAVVIAGSVAGAPAPAGVVPPGAAVASSVALADGIVAAGEAAAVEAGLPIPSKLLTSFIFKT